PPTLPLDSIEDLCSKEGHSTEEILDGIQLALDAAGFIPAFGAVPDLLNAAIYAFRGKWLEAGMSIVAAVPGIGDAVAGVKIAKKGYDAAKISKMAKRSVGKNVDVSIKGLVSRGYSKEEAVMFRRAVRNERRNVARKFYEDAGFKRTDIDSHLHGIDFKKPVVIETVPPPSTLYQYQTLDLKTGKWRSGNYYTPDPKAKPSDLGIYDKFSFTECGLEFEKRHTKITEVKAQQALKTSAYSVHDNWSVKGKEVLTKGGGIQYFMPLH
ncbi:MAG: hypothetical protein LIO91_00785, partial [Bacteroidales bacterium]|nr:hypothetical protein [Bacteroidales bacterium]